MKNSVVTFFLLMTAASWAQPKNGDVVANLSFSLLNAPQRTITLSQLKGKVVVIEFWATWCGSCIVAMPHLAELQKQFPNELRILSVSNESSTRIRKFLKARPTEVWFATDSLQQVSNTFPHHIIPHTVVISPEGLLVANTSPELVTADVVESLIRRQTPLLAEKKDNNMSVDELLKTYFHASDTASYRFIIQPKINGAPGFSTTYAKDSLFQGRRITAVNCSLSNLYRLAYGNISYTRTVDKINMDIKKMYCVDLIVGAKNELLSQLKRELASHFEVHSEMKSEAKEVYVLKIVNQKKLASLPLTTTEERAYSARHGEMDGKCVTLADVSDYLESFGIVSLPVVDETGDQRKYDIQFSFQPEDPSSLTKALEDMGLKLEKSKRDVPLLYLW